MHEGLRQAPAIASVVPASVSKAGGVTMKW